MLDIMLADCPRVIYTDKEKITKKDIEDAERRTKELQQKSKHGLGINFKKQLNANEYLKGKMKTT